MTNPNPALNLNISNTAPVDSVEDYQFEPIKGYPMLNWKGKRPFTNTLYYPAQRKEKHGDEVNGWLNKIFWGDNLQVMSHLLKEFRGKINLIYIDPPFDSKADYKKKISLKGQQITNDLNSFEEKQYTDIWTNDEYLQFMYERLILIRELLADNGSIYLHCDYHKSHYLRCILDELFGINNFVNEIIWKRRGGSLNNFKSFGSIVDTLLLYGKSDNYKFNSLKSKDTPEAQEYIKERFVYDDGDGRLYSRDPVTNPSSNPTPSLIYEYKGYKPPAKGWAFSIETMKKWDEMGKLYLPENKEQRIRRKTFLNEYEGQPIQNLWFDIYVINSQARESEGYPTQKPEALLERIIKASTNEGDIVFDCFMGSGTTQAVAMKLGRRFIGADINLGAVQITTKRLLGIASDLNQKTQENPQIPINFNSKTDNNKTKKKAKKDDNLTDNTQDNNLNDNQDELDNIEDELENNNQEISTYYTGFEVYNVNHYDVFRNPLEARELLLEALEVHKLPEGNLFDGEKDGRMIKIMPVNRIATRKDLNELIAGFDYKSFERRQEENPNKPVEKITLICMGHEPDLGAKLKAEVLPYKLDVEVLDILRDRQDLQFKRDSEAKIEIKRNKLVIEKFYPLNLLNKLSMAQEKVDDWRELVESIMIDWNYDGGIFEPKLVDIPPKNELVIGSYEIPKDAGTIRVKITDLLSESLEMDLIYL